MDKSEKLDAVGLDAWTSFLQMSQLMLQIVDRQLRRDSGMPHAYYAALVALAKEDDDGGVLLTDLADALSYSQSRMSHAVKKMEDARWIVRRTDPIDRRVVRLALSETGRIALARATVRHMTVVKENFIEPLSPEQLGQLVEIGETLLPILLPQVVAADALPALQRYIGRNGTGSSPDSREGQRGA